MTGAAAKQTVVDLKKKNAVLEEEKAELKKKIPSVHEKMEAAAQRSRLESQNRQLWSENEELKEALEEERSFSVGCWRALIGYWICWSVTCRSSFSTSSIRREIYCGASDLPAGKTARERSFLGRYEPVKIACPKGLATGFRTGYNNRRK